MSYMDMITLPVGQGSCNLFCFYDGPPTQVERKLEFLFWVDCGSDQTIYKDGKQLPYCEHIDYTFRFIRAKMIERGGTNGPRVDILLITHQDRDHWNLITKVLANDFYTVVTDRGGNILRKYVELVENVNRNIETVCYTTITEKAPKGVTQTVYSVNGTRMNVDLDSEVQINLKYVIDKNSMKDTILIKVQTKLLQVEIEMNKYNKDNTYAYKGKKCDSQKNEEVCIEIRDDGSQYIGEISFLQHPPKKKPKVCVPKESANFHEFTAAFIKDNDRVVRLLDTLFAEISQVKYDDIIKKVNDHIVKQKGKLISNTLIGGHEESYTNDFKALGVILKTYSDYVVSLATEKGEIKLQGLVYPETFSFQLLCCLQETNPNKIDLNQIKGGTKLKKIKGDFNDIYKNFSSAVVLLKDRKEKFMITGDATVHTMLHINKTYKKKEAECDIMLAPHHGSERTSKGYLKTGKEKPHPWSILKDFLKNTNPVGIYISAGYKNTHGLPNKMFVDIAKDIVKPNFNEHYIYYGSPLKGKTRNFVYDKIDQFLETNVEVFDDRLSYSVHILYQDDMRTATSKEVEKLDTIQTLTTTRGTPILDRASFLEYK